MNNFFSFKSIITVDNRALGLMRIGIGLVLITDVLTRMSNLHSHYTEEGVLPIQALFAHGWNPFYFSFFTISTNSFITFFLFGLFLISAITLTLGIRTKISTIVCWLFLISVHNRNPLIHQGGDDLLRLILFWGIFLPWEKFYSVDQKHLHQDFLGRSSSGINILGYLLQIAYVYFISALLKNSSEWNQDFTAIYYALSFDQIVLPVGEWIYPYPGLLKALTISVYYIELVFPFLLFIPFYNSFFRGVFFVGIFLLHIGIALTLNVGLFPYIAVAGMLGILPAGIMEKFSSNNIGNNLAKFFNYLKRKINYDQIKIKKSYVLKNTTQVLIAFFIVYIMVWNLSVLKMTTLIKDFQLEWVAKVIRVDQHWGMFAPTVFKDDGWFTFTAQTKSGESFNIIQQPEGDSLKLSAASPLFKEDRWRKYSENLLFINQKHYRLYFCHFLLKNWNSKFPNEPIDTVSIFYTKEISRPNYTVERKPTELLCRCY